MKIYKDYSPTAFDAKGLNGDREGINGFMVLLGRWAKVSVFAARHEDEVPNSVYDLIEEVTK